MIRYDSFYHSLSLVAIGCHSLSFVLTRYHLLSLVVRRMATGRHLLYHWLAFLFTHCHSLSLVVPVVVNRYHSMYHSSVFLYTIHNTFVLTDDYKAKVTGVNYQDFLCVKWVKDIWNYKEESGLQNRKSHILNSFRASVFAKKVFTHHGS